MMADGEQQFKSKKVTAARQERVVIQDWLQLEGRAKGDPTPWIDAIARETHGCLCAGCRPPDTDG